MKSRILIIGLVLFVILGGILVFSNLDNKETSNSDAIKFKEEYESLNGMVNENNGNEHRTISIDSDNPFIYKEADDIVDMINNKESFAVYFGFDSCPWCRSVIPTLIEAAKDNDIDKIYYVDVKEIRDTITVNEDGEFETTKEGTSGYYNLIKLLDNVLSDYTVTDLEGNKISTNEKRIFAPNVVVVLDGEAVYLESGISELQTDGYMQLTSQMTEDTYNMFNGILEHLYKRKNTCDVNVGC